MASTGVLPGVMRPLAIAILLVVLSPLGALGQTPYRPSECIEKDEIRPPKGANNAVWTYFKAWDTITTREELVAFTEAVGNYPKKGEKLTPEQRRQLDEHRAYIDGVLAASAIEECDWGARTEQGPLSLLPYLGLLRNSIRALGVDAIRCAEDGNSMGAAERLAAEFRIALHSTTDHYFICSLVAGAIANHAVSRANDFLDQGALTVAARRHLFRALAPLLSPDPFHTREAIELERRSTTDWLRRECRSDNPGQSFIRGLNEGAFLSGWRVSSFHNPLDLRLWHILKMTEQQVTADLDRADRYFDEIKRAWGVPHARARLEELEEQASEGQWGFTAQALGSRFLMFRSSMDRCHRDLQRLESRLRASLEDDAAKPQENAQ
jgi:hypothetical protein